MSENTKSNITNVEMSESDLESQSLNESGMLTVGPSAVTAVSYTHLILCTNNNFYHTTFSMYC